MLEVTFSMRVSSGIGNERIQSRGAGFRNQLSRREIMVSARSTNGCDVPELRLTLTMRMTL